MRFTNQGSLSVRLGALVFAGIAAPFVLPLAAPLAAQGGGFWLARSAAANPWPMGVIGHSASFEAGRERVVVFGGSDGLAFLDTTREWTGVDWLTFAPSVLPPARGYHAATSLAPLPGILIHGGAVAGAQPPVADTWEWDGSTWTQRAAGGPPARWLHAMALDPGRAQVVMFGGASNALGTAPLNDTWLWDGVQWLPATPATTPPARLGHAMAYDLVAGRVVMFGGTSSALGSTALNDTWEWDGGNWVQRTPIASPTPRAYHTLVWNHDRIRTVLHGGRSQPRSGGLADAWEWDSAANTWRQLAAVLPSPGARDLHAAAYDYRRARGVMVGGYDFNRLRSLGDTWEWFAQVPIASAVTYGTGCAGSRGVPNLTAVGGVPQLGNLGFGLQLSNACASAPAALLLGAAPDQLLLDGGCALRVALPFTMFAALTDAGGATTWPLPVANVVDWLGVDLYAQAVVADPMGAWYALATFSNGQALLLGN